MSRNFIKSMCLFRLFVFRFDHVISYRHPYTFAHFTIPNNISVSFEHMGNVWPLKRHVNYFGEIASNYWWKLNDWCLGFCLQPDRQYPSSLETYRLQKATVKMDLLRIIIVLYWLHISLFSASEVVFDKVTLDTITFTTK